MAHMLIRQLERFIEFSPEEKLALRAAGMPPRRFPAHHDLVRDDEPAGTVNVLLAGFACRYVVLPNGRRQILSYLLPGDFCDLRACIVERMDHNIGTLTAVKLASFSRTSVSDLARRFPQVARALALLTAAEEATSRQWLLNLGRRTAFERAAHLLCELFTRLQSVGLATETTCELPLTQTDLADALALSPVHVNRTLMEMRRRKLATFSRHQLVIKDFQALQQAAGFKPGYLQPQRQPAVFCEMRTAIEVQALATAAGERPAAEPRNEPAPIRLEGELCTHPPGGLRRSPPPSAS
jgi:CRP-like cAMP-binding protein